MSRASGWKREGESRKATPSRNKSGFDCNVPLSRRRLPIIHERLAQTRSVLVYLLRTGHRHIACSTHTYTQAIIRECSRATVRGGVCTRAARVGIAQTGGRSVERQVLRKTAHRRSACRPKKAVAKQTLVRDLDTGRHYNLPTLVGAHVHLLAPARPGRTHFRAPITRGEQSRRARHPRR